jgi:hypothetical protein
LSLGGIFSGGGAVVLGSGGGGGGGGIAADGTISGSAVAVTGPSWGPRFNDGSRSRRSILPIHRPNEGQRAYVTDATTAAPAFMSTLVGAGTQPNALHLQRRGG